MSETDRQALLILAAKKAAQTSIAGWSDKDTQELEKLITLLPAALESQAELARLLVEEKATSTPEELLRLIADNNAARDICAKLAFFKIFKQLENSAVLQQVSRAENWAFLAGILQTQQETWKRPVIDISAALAAFVAIAEVLTQTLIDEPGSRSIPPSKDSELLENWLNPVEILTKGSAGPSLAAENALKYLSEHPGMNIRFGARISAMGLEKEVEEILENIRAAAGQGNSPAESKETLEEQERNWSNLGSASKFGVLDFIAETYQWGQLAPQAGLGGINGLIEGRLGGPENPPEPCLKLEGSIGLARRTKHTLSFLNSGEEADIVEIVYVLDRTSLGSGEDQAGGRAERFRKLAEEFPAARVFELMALWNFDVATGTAGGKLTVADYSGKRVANLILLTQNNPGLSPGAAMAAVLQSETAGKAPSGKLGLIDKVGARRFAREARALLEYWKQDEKTWRENRGLPSKAAGPKRTLGKAAAAGNTPAPQLASNPAPSVKAKGSNPPDGVTLQERFEQAQERIKRLGDRYVDTVTSPDFYLDGPAVLDRNYPPMNDFLTKLVHFQDACTKGNQTRAAEIADEAVALLREARNGALELKMQPWLHSGRWKEYAAGVEKILPTIQRRNKTPYQGEKQAAHTAAKRQIAEHALGLLGAVNEVDISRRLLELEGRKSPVRAREIETRPSKTAAG